MSLRCLVPVCLLATLCHAHNPVGPLLSPEDDPLALEAHYPALYALAPFGFFEDKREPVVDATSFGGHAQVLVRGRLRDLDDQLPLLLPSGRFQPGHAEITQFKTDSRRIPDHPRARRLFCKIRFVPSRDFGNSLACFVVRRGGELLEMHWDDLGELPAGKRKTLRHTYIYGSEEPQPEIALLLFSSGGEILTGFRYTRSAGVNSELPAWLRGVTFGPLMQAYLEAHRGETRMPEAYYRVVPSLSPDQRKALLSKAPRIKGVITAAGTVTGTQALTDLPDATAAEVARAVSLWTYFPYLEDGQPLTRTVSIPVELDTME